ncbi:hypothetical protein BJX65DRAFT_305360 [Aspergillus insuetus]
MSCPTYALSPLLGDPALPKLQRSKANTQPQTVESPTVLSPTYSQLSQAAGEIEATADPDNAPGIPDCETFHRDWFDLPYEIMEPQLFEQTSPPAPVQTVPAYAAGPIWPLKTEFEVFLFQYFLTDLSPWFDFCDPRRHFRTYIANAAATDHTILYAILAVSARHQGVSSEWMRSFAEECHENCLAALISALNDQENAVQETVFASAVILRLFEEMTAAYLTNAAAKEPYPRESISSHTISAQLLIRVRDGNILASEFTDAAFIVILRQEIFVANLVQRPVGTVTEHCNIDTSLDPASDVMWAFRAIALAARVTNYVYDEVQNRTRDRWGSLMQYLQDWENLRPPSFNPIYSEAANVQCSPFPRILYCNDYHVAARQHLELSRILLLASDPGACQMLIGRRTRMGRNHDAAIRECVLDICGVAVSNNQYMPARLTAGLVISMCGELFHKPQETRSLFAILSDAESHLGWPCLKSKDDLKRLWELPD